MWQFGRFSKIQSHNYHDHDDNHNNDDDYWKNNEYHDHDDNNQNNDGDDYCKNTDIMIMMTVRIIQVIMNDDNDTNEDYKNNDDSKMMILWGLQSF